MGRVLYPSARALLQRPAAEALARVHAALAPHGLGLLVYDAYRPWSVTRAMWDETPEEQRRFVADPATGSKHNRGCAVDATLCEVASGVALPMPSAFDEFTERASADYAGGSAEGRANRARLIDAMASEGFAVNPREWWHFGFRDWAAYPVLGRAAVDFVLHACEFSPKSKLHLKDRDLIKTWRINTATDSQLCRGAATSAPPTGGLLKLAVPSNGRALLPLMRRSGILLH